MAEGGKFESRIQDGPAELLGPSRRRSVPLGSGELPAGAPASMGRGSLYGTSVSDGLLGHGKRAGSASEAWSNWRALGES